MTLKVTTEPRENRQLAVSIEVPQERVEQELRKAAAKVANQYRLPGFRKGKAPYAIVVQQFGLANLYNEFVDKLGDEVYKAALEQEQIQPYAMAQVEDIGFEPLTYKLVVPLEPVVELNDYRSVRVEPDAVEPDESAVDARLEELRGERAAWQSVDRPSQYGDMLTIDVKSIIAPAAEGDEPIVVLDETDWDVTPDEENPMDPPGFDAALVGMRPGETKEFTLAWPADSRSIYAGKEAVFTVALKQIQAYDMPALDDAFAKQVNEEVESLEQLRERLRADLAAQSEADRTSELINKALDAIVAQATLEYPPAVIEDQLDSMLQTYEQRLRMVGIESLDRFFQQTGQDADEFRESLRSEAELSARRNLILSEVIRREQLDVTPEEIEERIAAMTEAPADAEVEADAQAQMDAMSSLLNSPTGRSLVLNDLIREKGVQRVLAIVRGEELPEPGPAVEDAAADEAVAATSSEEAPTAGESAAPADEADEVTEVGEVTEAGEDPVDTEAAQS